ncbi:MAG: hypothetical protein A2X94_15305 [Bdellovibrionales bacterium GWB1_55_8]|nr:MAG: hypothetical protein A2X94_15305 [Bdellovibrionales bacterium GWB1_55_8]
MRDRLEQILRIILLILSSGSTAFAAPAQLYQGFIYQGRFLTPDGQSAMTDVVDLVIGVYSPDGNCLLYEQQDLNIDLSLTSGLFSVHVGSEVGNPKRVAGRDPGKSISVIFSNASPVVAAGPNCPGGYTPSPGDPRKLRVTVYPHGGASETMSPDLTITPVPQATVAETLQGLDPTKFVQITGAASSYELSKSALDTIFGFGGPQDASSLHHHDAVYAQLAVDGSLSLGSGKYLGLGVQSGSPDTTGWSSDSTKTGRTWFDSGSGEIKYWDGANVKTLGIDSGTSPSAAAPLGYDSGTGEFSITAASGVSAGSMSSAHYLDLFGATNASTSSTLVKRDGSGNFSAGTITASLTGNVTGNVSGTASNVTGTVAIGNGGTGQTTSSAAFNALAPSQAGNAGKFLTTDGSGAVSWGVPGSSDSTKLPLAGGTMSGAIAMGGNNITGAGYVGIGTTSPGFPLEVRSSSTLPAGSASIFLSGNSNNERFELRSANASVSQVGPIFQGKGADGTITTPGATAANTVLFGLGGSGYDGSQWITANRAMLRMLSAEPFSSTNQGTYITLETTAIGTTTKTERMRIGDSGNVGIGTTSPNAKLDVNGSVNISGSVTSVGSKETVVAAGTCATSYSINPNNGTMLTLTLNGACQLGITALAAGHSFSIWLSQSSTVAPTFTSEFKWPGGTTPVWSTTAGKKDVIVCASFDGITLTCNGMIDVR